MCIICVKKSNIDFPSDKVFKTMFDNNDDGAGFMWADGNCVHIHKGFMKYKDFKNDLETSKKKYHLNKMTPMVFHFRISTHAGVQKRLCHPFGLEMNPNNDAVHSLNCAAPVGIAHNGVMPIKADENESDTSSYVMHTMIGMYKKNHDFWSDKITIKKIEADIKSKMAILTKDGDIKTIGLFETDKNGLMYSNSSYKEPRIKFYSYYNNKSSYTKPYQPYYDEKDYWYGWSKCDDQYDEDEENTLGLVKDYNSYGITYTCTPDTIRFYTEGSIIESYRKHQFLWYVAMKNNEIDYYLQNDSINVYLFSKMYEIKGAIFSIFESDGDLFVITSNELYLISRSPKDDIEIVSTSDINNTSGIGDTLEKIIKDMFKKYSDIKSVLNRSKSFKSK